MRINLDNTNGVWDPSQGCIIILRRQLTDLATYAGTLLHETAHAIEGNSDATLGFEQDLTRYLGLTVKVAVTR